MPFPLAELVLRGSGLVPDFRVFQFDVAANLSFALSFYHCISKKSHFQVNCEHEDFFPGFCPSHLDFRAKPHCPHRQRQVCQPCGVAARARHGAGACCAWSRWRLPGMLRPQHPRELTRELSPRPRPPRAPALFPGFGVPDGNRLCADSCAPVGPSAPSGPGFHVRWPPSGPRVSARAIPVSADLRCPPADPRVPR